LKLVNLKSFKVVGGGWIGVAGYFQQDNFSWGLPI
jgi:hypothetical protein